MALEDSKQPNGGVDAEFRSATESIMGREVVAFRQNYQDLKIDEKIKSGKDIVEIDENESQFAQQRTSYETETMWLINEGGQQFGLIRVEESDTDAFKRDNPYAFLETTQGSTAKVDSISGHIVNIENMGVGDLFSAAAEGRLYRLNWLK